VNGKQQWGGYQYPGLITTHPTGTENYAIKNKFKVGLLGTDWMSSSLDTFLQAA